MKHDAAMLDCRTRQQLEEHFRIERELADRLRHATREERRKLYPAVYEELYARVPLHPMLTRKRSAEETSRAVAGLKKLLWRFLRPNITFLEIGAGDCALSFAVAKHVRQVYGLEVSETITAAASRPANFRLLLSDGFSIALPSNSVQLAFSNQLMEHLHPDDAAEQLREIYRVLAPGGTYLCLTPNRLTGPHDVSRYFTSEATGFHLKEYTLKELGTLFHSVGFSKLRTYWGVKGKFISLGLPVYRLLEAPVWWLPGKMRREWSGGGPLRMFNDLRLAGTK